MHFPGNAAYLWIENAQQTFGVQRQMFWVRPANVDDVFPWVRYTAFKQYYLSKMVCDRGMSKQGLYLQMCWLEQWRPLVLLLPFQVALDSTQEANVYDLFSLQYVIIKLWGRIEVSNELFQQENTSRFYH